MNSKSVEYQYHNAPVPGGGFVTGFLFHPLAKGILYARTDIGGVYRYDFAKRNWKSLIDHVTHLGKWETNPLSIALDRDDPETLYIVAGDNREKSFLCISPDRGESFNYLPIPGPVHGNAPGRGTGERLQADPYEKNLLYFGSMSRGLLRSEDRGKSWEPLRISPPGGKEELNIAFVWLDEGSGKTGQRCRTLVVATDGSGNADARNRRAPGLYISYDAGASFAPMPGQPAPPARGNYPGFVGQRAAFENGFLYITLASVLNSWRGFAGYGCDMGGAQYGKVLRYTLDPENRTLSGWQDISPDAGLDCGFGGICADLKHPGRLICATQCAGEDAIFLTRDHGLSWRPILRGLSIGRMNFTVPYMKSDYNGGGNLIHWLSDLKIDPFDSNRAVFNTGTGIFMTENLEEAAAGADSVWAPSCDGLEETVHLNVYSPPDGPVKLIDIIGDLGAFAFKDLTKPVENSFADSAGNRYITCLNADFPDKNPYLVVVSARGNWRGRTTGGLILSEDQCDTWTRLPDPLGIHPALDALIRAIRQPNTNAGWTAISADAQTILWCVGQGNRLPIHSVVYTGNRGSSWQKSTVFDLEGRDISQPLGPDGTENTLTLKVLADRDNPMLFYGFGDGSLFYVSLDSGKTFRQIPTPPAFPRLELGGMDGRMPAEIRAESGKSRVWIATGPGGLWTIDYADKPVFTRITAEGDAVFRQGMGKAAGAGQAAGGGHAESPHTLYINGTLSGEYGFWRSTDEGKTFTRINNDKQMFGDIRSIVGDPRSFGRFYLATGSRGVLWGEPK